PSAAERDEKEEFPAEAVRKLGALGFMGMMVPPEYGGSGLDMVSYVLAIEEISKVDASCGVIMSVNNSLVCYGLDRWGSAPQKEKYLRELATGRKLGAFALSEPEAGTKNFITNGSNADIVLVMAATDRSKGANGVCTFIVDKGTPGFSVAKKERKLGIRSSDTVSLAFQECFVPAENRIGEEGFGFKFAMKTLDGGRIGIAAQALGIAMASRDASVRYSKQRKAFGQYLAEFQAIQFKIADMATKIEAAQMLTMKAAALKDSDKPFAHYAAMAKLYASRVAVECALEAIQIHGGYGYIKEYTVERYLRDAKITEIYEGTSEVQRIVISRTLLKN
ncbi:MAG: acyl-CoA dehydrogenase, partial [Ignavibacteria bacterium 13_1_40CM_2_61_4]